jgi:hypothetical protein
MLPGGLTSSGRRLGIALAGLFVLGMAGCGGNKLYSARGRVIFDDDNTPLAGGWITFDPVDGSGKKGAFADIQGDGTFQLGTYHAGDGAIEGKYRAVIKPPLGAGRRSEESPIPRVIDPRYENFATSPLEFTITSDRDKNDFTLKVKRADDGNPRRR